jgi:hypothetical protein
LGHLADHAHSRFDVNHIRQEKRSAQTGLAAGTSWNRCNRIDSNQFPDGAIQRCFFMSSHERPPLRHCPVCGVAMQASKSQENLNYFDKFECLSCHTVISESTPKPPAGEYEPR